MKNLLILLFFIASFCSNLRAQTLISESNVETVIGRTSDGVYTAIDITTTSVYSNPPSPGTYTTVTKTCAWTWVDANGERLTGGTIPCSGGTCTLVLNSDGATCLTCTGSSDPGSTVQICNQQVQ